MFRIKQIGIIMSDIEFKYWLMEQVDRDDPIGDLANDVKADKSEPIDSSSFDGWYSFMASKFSHAALSAFEEAWTEYSVDALK